MVRFVAESGCERAIAGSVHNPPVHYFNLSSLNGSNRRGVPISARVASESLFEQRANKLFSSLLV